MTQFKNLELIYNEFSKLTEEIDSLIKEEDYKEATTKLRLKTKLTKRLHLAKKTTSLTEEQSKKLTEIENQIRELEQKHIVLLSKLQLEVGEDLKKTKGKVKISSAYSAYKPKKQGTIVDFSE